MADEIEDFDDDLDLTLYADPVELLSQVLSQLNEVIEIGLRVNGEFHLALTGGTLGTDLSKALVGGSATTLISLASVRFINRIGEKTSQGDHSEVVKGEN